VFRLFFRAAIMLRCRHEVGVGTGYTGNADYGCGGRLPGAFSVRTDADMVPLNDAANAVGVPKLDVALYGTG
jgi:hypothetical protein